MKKYKIKLMNGKDFTQTKEENEEFIQRTYKRAKIRTLKNGTKELFSYETKVAIITKGGNFIRLWDGYSQTTMKHINEFRKQNNLPRLNKKEWMSLEVNNNLSKLKFVLENIDGTKKEYFELNQINQAINRLGKRLKETFFRWDYEIIESYFEDAKEGQIYQKDDIQLRIARI